MAKVASVTKREVADRLVRRAVASEVPALIELERRCSAHRTGLARRGHPALRQPGSEPIRLNGIGEGDPTAAVNVRYRPITT